MGDDTRVQDESENESRGVNESVPSADVGDVGKEDTSLVDVVGGAGGQTITLVAEAEGLFSREEHERFSMHRQKVKFKGFSFMQVKELDYMYKNWPDSATFTSRSPHFLRGLAVTYFYQSQMVKARELLLKVWKSVQDLDVALMLAECACALPTEGNETFNAAYSRLCDYTKNSPHFTSKHVEGWDERLKKNGRFMGYIILQLALYRKLAHSGRVKNPKHLIYSCIRKISHALYGVVDDRVLKTSPQLGRVLIYLFETLKKIIVEFNVVATPKNAYAEVFLSNCLAYLNVCSGNYSMGLKWAATGLNILEFKYQVDEGLRMVKGDLFMNQGAALFMDGQYGEAQNEFHKALQIYQNSTEGFEHPAVRSRMVALATEAHNHAIALDAVV